VKEVPVGSRPVTIGRSPDNDIPVDNLAVSNYHAKIYFEAGRMVVEDLDSLNGTFVNDLRVERATLHDGDNIHIGKHKIKVDTSGDAPIAWDTGRKAPRHALMKPWFWTPRSAARCSSRPPPWANPCSLPARA